MAEKTNETNVPAESAAAEPAKKRSRLGVTGIVAAVMVVEGVAIFGVMKMFGSHPDAAEAELLAPASKPAMEDAELEVVQLRAMNVKSGRPVLYSIKVFVRVASDKADSVKSAIEKKKASIEDAVARIIRSAEPTHLSEDGLETLRRQIQFELSRLVADASAIQGILIPECTPYPTGF
ncbi:MAG: hypothetical protein L6Q92_00510 [Phycisphaerae bacterium]|nr:hypothetical protein [Phycisphaerae bacterium]